MTRLSLKAVFLDERIESRLEFAVDPGETAINARAIRKALASVGLRRLLEGIGRFRLTDSARLQRCPH
jgi:hypothetical protein